jgi:hypothetical protein
MSPAVLNWTRAVCWMKVSDHAPFDVLSVAAKIEDHYGEWLLILNVVTVTFKLT